jgi:hypothetical protein
MLYLSGLAIGLAALVSALDPEKAAAAKFKPPTVPSYLRSLGKPTATGYSLGDHGVPYDCLFWKRRGGVEVVEYCVVDNSVGATLHEGRSPRK